MAKRNTRQGNKSRTSTSRRPHSRNKNVLPKTLSKLPPVEAPQEFRLQKFLASAGLGSRRQCEELIRTGRITVDGMPVENPGINIDPKKQSIEFDGENLKPQKLKYFVLNKPKGVLCTNNDPQGRTRVIDLFSREKVRLFPVGRLDDQSEGLLIVTNDGDFAHQLAHPRYRIYRTYRIQVAGFPTSEDLQRLRDGIFFQEGKFRVISVKRAGKMGKSSFLEIVLGEGHNREVRRLFAKIGHKVMSLERTAFGPIKLAKLKRGQYRELTAVELNELREMLVRNRSTPTKKRPRPEQKRNKPASEKRSIKKSITKSSHSSQAKKATTEKKKGPKIYVFK